jgi:hypothetical protein
MPGIRWVPGNHLEVKMIVPKQLRKITTGQIFSYTEALAKRKDMIPHWPHNVDPNVPSSGLGTEAAKDIAFKEAFGQAEKEIQSLQAYISTLEDEKKQLLDENQKLLSIVNNAPQKETQDVPMADRQAIINEAVRSILNDKNKHDITTTGLPRIEAIEAVSGLSDVTASEREIAMER